MEHFGLSMKRRDHQCCGRKRERKTTVIRAEFGALPGAGRVTDGDSLSRGIHAVKSKEEWQKIRGTKISMIFRTGDFEPDSEDRQVCGIHMYSQQDVKE